MRSEPTARQEALAVRPFGDMAPSKARRAAAPPPKRERVSLIAVLRSREALAAALAGGLAFLIQPLAARTLLPAVGGSAIVWATTLAFFQMALVIGYLVAVWIARRPARAWGLVLAILPTPLLWSVPDVSAPWNVVLALAGGVGLPYVALASVGVSLQATHRSEGSPYRLAAASNIGSATGLVLGIILSEFVGLTIQRSVWWGLTAATILFAAPRIAAGVASPQPLRGVERSARITWIAWSALASGLLVGISTAISIRIEILPMLWPVPLGIFLILFARVFADDRTRRRVDRTFGWLLGGAGVLALTPALIAGQGGAGEFNLAVFTAYVLLFTVVAWIAIRRLADARPEPSNLGAFWVWVAIGGGIGGAVVALLVPVVLPWPWELTVLSLAAAIATPAAREAAPEFRIVGGLIATVAVAVVVFGQPLEVASGGDLPIALVAFVIAITVIGWRAIAAGIAAVAMVGVALLPPFGPAVTAVERGRSAYGSWAVGEAEGVRVLFHNDILHGLQEVEEPLRFRPSSYYGVTTGLGQAIATLEERPGWSSAGVAVVGVGTGTVVAYAEPGQRWDLFELDPDMFYVARNLFTYLGDAPADTTHEYPGDARIELEGRPDDTYDLLILDAYLGDSVPPHLLSTEAFALYDAKRRPGGVIAAHVSSRMFDLAPIVAAGAESIGLTCRSIDSEQAEPTATEPYQSDATWVLCSDDPAFLEAIADAESSEVQGRLVWTDDLAPLLRALD